MRTLCTRLAKNFGENYTRLINVIKLLIRVGLLKKNTTFDYVETRNGVAVFKLELHDRSENKN
jgi:predicted transcriptional regulator